MRPEAIIFDLDGVLADTTESHYRAWKQIALELGRSFAREDMTRFRGRQRRDCLLDLLGDHQLPETEIERLLILKDTYCQADIATMTAADLLPGVASFVESAYQQGVRQGVASSSANARQVLQQTGLMPYLQAVGDGLTVARSKPAPDIFVWVAGALHVRPADAVVIEDSLVGVEAALKAGMMVVGVGPDLTGNTLTHLYVRDLSHLRLSDLEDVVKHQ
jgi:beta-phosphoglucomutase